MESNTLASDVIWLDIETAKWSAKSWLIHTAASSYLRSKVEARIDNIVITKYWCY